MIFAKLNNWLVRARLALRSPYARLLEDEVAREREEVTRQRAEVDRLRIENRALLNSLLGTAGVPPIETPPLHPANIAPVRRRSWTQIARTHEIELGREIESAREVRMKERARERQL